jgi:hypothetical protein
VVRLRRWRAMPIHPTVYEMIPYMFDDLQPLEWSVCGAGLAA